MLTSVHKLFIDSVKDAIRSQLKTIRDRTNRAALFAQRVWPARSTAIYFLVDVSASSTMSKHEPDASFWHDDAQYPSSDASVQVVVGLDIEYGQKGSRRATLSVWRTHLAHTGDGDELRVVQVIADEAFRDDEGHPTDLPGLRFQLSDFACEELTQESQGT
ncbi:hypothetical protein PMIN01_03928 [Paraphaeosphaeria minitans]|uniref:Uncharacterized protein n=1 Tax=Paraphaeosphaeria minitans TaxID=565426 RepID=A0A9P6GPB9_9PLEO|nr:hypothetical protein PMIN01_03928 [Paraphaeosphaeria minitans]